VDLIVVGGDVVPGPMPRDVLRCLLHLDVQTRFISGNGEREVLAQIHGVESAAIPETFRDVMRWNASEVRRGFQDVLAGWPALARVSINGIGRVLFCHATPQSDSDIFLRTTPEERLAPIFGPADADVVVCGHTHMQFDRMVGSTRVVNAGSVGMPFGHRGAYWLLLGPGVELRTTSYDFEAAAARVRATSYPQAEAFASGSILHPPTESAMLEAFACASL
jgi:predicted phosphodiesterase